MSTREELEAKIPERRSGASAAKVPAEPSNSQPHDILALQRLIGNRAVQQLLGHGNPLPDGLRANMERSFSADFRSVRLHGGPGAAAMNRTLSSRAFASGSNVVLGDAAPDPESRQGRPLLAHELTHIVQARGESSGTQAGADIVPQGGPAEREADAAADAVTRGLPIPPIGTALTSGAIARDTGETAAPAPAVAPAVAPAKKNPWPEPSDYPLTGDKAEDDKKVGEFIQAMAKCWTDHPDALGLLVKDSDWAGIADKLKSKTASAADVETQLRTSFKRDVGAFAKSAGPTRIAGAWMVARVEEFRFHAAGWRRFGSHWPAFTKSDAHERDTADLPADIRQAHSIQIAPGLAKFLTALHEVYKGFKASNYGTHMTGMYQDQGMSVDIYLRNTTKDGLWWDTAEAIGFLKAVDELAGTEAFAGTRWIALYNHFEVARAINADKDVKRGTVRFRGGGNTYHGPDPAKLHIHLEVIVPSDKAVPAPPPKNNPPPAPAT